MSEESSPQSNRAQRRRRPVTHDQPIIIDGVNSVAIEFDGSHPSAHYPQVSESVYTGVGLFISSVSVRFDRNARPGSGTQCPLPTGFYTVAIGSKHPQTQDGSTIRVTTIPGALIVSVDPRKFPEQSQNGNRKRRRNPAFKMETLTFRDVITGAIISDCSDLLRQSDGKCFIDIIDDHVLSDVEFLAQQFDARTE